MVGGKHLYNNNSMLYILTVYNQYICGYLSRNSGIHRTRS